jgi:hypothetical protein
VVSKRSALGSSVLAVVGVGLLVAAFAVGFAPVEPPGYPSAGSDTPCGRVFLSPQRWGECGDLMATQTAWVIGLGVTGALALLVPPTMRATLAVRRMVLVLVLAGAALGYGVGTVLDHLTTAPTPLFGASAAAIVLPGLYLAFLGLDGATARDEQRAAAST